MAGAVTDLRRGHRHRLGRATVEAALEHDHVGSTRDLAHELHRALDGFGPGVGVEEPLDAVGRDLVEARAELLEQRVPIHVHLRMDEATGLLPDRGDHVGMAMTGVHHADPAGEVEVLGAVGRGDDGARAGHDVEVGDAEPDVGDVRIHGLSDS